MQLHAVYFLLQVTRTVSKRAMKSKVRMIKSLSPEYQARPEKMHTCNNTDGYKWGTFSGIALYYGDTCSTQYCMVCTPQYFKRVAKIAIYF